MKFKDTDYGDLSGQHYEGSIDVIGKRLTSLEGAPETVSGSFECFNNKLTTLEGAPRKVGVCFDCNNNQLTSLEGAPETVGSPEILGGSFYCNNNQLTSLEGMPKIIYGDFKVCENNISSLKDLKVDCFYELFHADFNPYEYIHEEFYIRARNKDKSEEEINELMYEETEDEMFLPDEVKNVFSF